MIRNNSFEDISDGRKYSSNDLVKAGCGGCVGCTECCGMVDTVLLDPYDVFHLCKALRKSFEGLIAEGLAELSVHEGLILPNLVCDKTTNRCKLLSPQGRCTVHNYRPGFCRLFPLGRIYDNDGEAFSYYMQTHECPYPNKTKVKVSRWLEIPELPRYEQFILKWHKAQKSLITTLKTVDDSTAQKINYGFIKLFYVTDYNTEEDFYPQFEERLQSLS